MAARRPPFPFADGLLADQSWLITGGGTGIGRAVAELAGSLGAKVAIASRRQENLEPTAAALREQGTTVLSRTCDIREPEQITALVDAVNEAHGPIDVLVNNAGGQFPAAAEGMSLKGFDAVIRNNLSGTFYMTQTVAKRAMIPQRRGAIVNVIANIYRGFAGMSHTGAARAGVDNLTKSLAVEWAQYDIRVNAVAPGIINSEAISKYPPAIVERTSSIIPFKRLGTVEETAVPIVFVASPAASYITGATLYVDGGSRLWGDLWQIPDRT